MTGRILHFPHIGQPASAPRERVFSFARVVVECGLVDCDPRTQVDTLRRMAREDGLPLPMNPRYWRGARQLGPASIGRKSTWDAAAFLEWQARQSNQAAAPTARIAHAPTAAPSLRAAMQARARQLRTRP